MRATVSLSDKAALQHRDRDHRVSSTQRRVLRLSSAVSSLVFFPLILSLPTFRVPLCGELSPPPQKIQLASSDSLRLQFDVAIVRDTALTSERMNALNEFIAQSLNLELTSNPQIWIIFHLFDNPTPPGVTLPYLETFPKIGTEGYTLVVDGYEHASVRITIAAEAEHGLFNGAMTALQLLLRGQGMDADAREDSILPQTIQDYPDHEIRGADWRLIQIVKICDPGHPGGGAGFEHYETPPSSAVYCLTDSARARIDALARHKVNFMVYAHGENVMRNNQVRLWDLSLEDSAWFDEGGEAAYAELLDYCTSRFIDVVPQLALGPQYRYEYVDGWWNETQPFDFGDYEGGIQYNYDFSRDDVDQDDLPDGWKVTSPYAADWEYTKDGEEPGPQQYMTLRQTTTRPFNESAKLEQVVRIRPGHQYYGLEVRLKGSDLPVRFTIQAEESLHTRVGTPRSKATTRNYAGWTMTDWQYWDGENLTPVEVPSGAQYIHAWVEAATGQAYSGSMSIAEFHIRPMHWDDTGADWRFDTDVPHAFAWPVEASLVSNGQMEELTPPSVRPDSWCLTAVGAGDSIAADPFVRQDTMIVHSGGASVRLCIPDSLDSETQNNIMVAKVIGAPDSTMGRYRLTAWVKASWTRPDSIYPELNFYTLNADSSVAEIAGLTIDVGYEGCSPDTTPWVRYQTDFEVTAPRESFVIYAHILHPSHGVLWIDDVSLVQLQTPMPLENITLNPSMESGTQGGLPTSYEPMDWGGSGRGWVWSSSEHHSGSHSVTWDDTLYLRASGAWVSDEIAQHFTQVKPGRYLLTAWVKATSAVDSLSLLPQVYLSCPAESLASNATTTLVGTPGQRWYDDKWTKIQTIMNVQPAAGSSATTADFYLIMRTWQTGAFYVDDVCVRRIDGDMHNTVDRIYKPVVQSWDEELTYEPDTDYELWRGPLDNQFDERSVPTRIADIQTYGTGIKVSYDQHLYHNFEAPYAQGANLCDTCATGILRTYYNKGSRRLLNMGFPGIVPGISEVLGFNRSGVGRSIDASNAEVLGNFMNAWIDTILAIKPTSLVWGISDMFSLYQNGNWGYERPSGGTPDPTGKTISDTTASYHLSTTAGLQSWFYDPIHFGAMSASGLWLNRYGYPMLQATWYDTTNATQAAALSRNLPRSLGGIATAWIVAPGVPPLANNRQDCKADSCQQRWIRSTSNRFWNTPWRQVYFTDFSSRLWSDVSSRYAGDVQYIDPDASEDTTRARLLAWCAPSWTPSNAGAIRFNTGVGSLILPAVLVDNGASYQAVLHARDLLGQNRTRDAKLIARWCKTPAGTVPYDSTETDISDLGGTGYNDAGTSVGAKNYFARRIVSISRDPETKYDHLVIRIEADAAQPGEASMSLDDVAIWESDAPCPQSDLDLRGPVAIDKGTIPSGTKYRIVAELQNEGCRDVEIYLLRTVAGVTERDSIDFYQTPPIVVSKSESVTISGQSQYPPDPGVERYFYLEVFFREYHTTNARVMQIPIIYETEGEL